jgi:hypothetical protein
VVAFTVSSSSQQANVTWCSPPLDAPWPTMSPSIANLDGQFPPSSFLSVFNPLLALPEVMASHSVLNGLNGGVRWQIPPLYPMGGAVMPVAADVDGSGLPEVSMGASLWTSSQPVIWGSAVPDGRRPRLRDDHGSGSLLRSGSPRAALLVPGVGGIGPCGRRGRRR